MHCCAKKTKVAPYISFFCNVISPTLWPVRELLCKHQVVNKVVVLNFLSPENYSEARWHPQVQNGDIALTPKFHHTSDYYVSIINEKQR